MNKNLTPHFELLPYDLTPNTCGELITKLLCWSRQNQGKPIVLIIYGCFSDFHESVAIVDLLYALRKRGHRLTTWAIGDLQGYCLAVFTAGQIRVISPNTYVKSTTLNFNAATGCISNVKAQRKFADRLIRCHLEILETSRRPRELENINSSYCYGAEDLVRLGYADQVGYIDLLDGLPRSEEETSIVFPSAEAPIQLQMFGQISKDAVIKSISTLLSGCEENPKAPIELVINSEGGNCSAAFALFDVLRAASNSGHHITVWMIGRAASAALTLAQAGDSRIIGPRAWAMFHEVRGTGSLGTPDEMEYKEFSLRFHQEITLKILASRSQASELAIEDLVAHTEFWLSAEECVLFGLADKVGYIESTESEESAQSNQSGQTGADLYIDW